MRGVGRAISLVALALVVGGGAAVADTDSAVAALERSLPKGWSLLSTDSELVIRHDRPCFRGEGGTEEKIVKKGEGRLITLELRYRLEAKWTPAQYADAKKANDAADAQIKAARAAQRIDQIKAVKGVPQPATADERARVEAFAKVEAAAKTHMVREPLCTFGDDSLFDSDATYAALSHPIDPPDAAKEALEVEELVKKQCSR